MIETALHTAVGQVNSSSLWITLLLRHSAQVDACDIFQRTALSLACSGLSDMGIVGELIEAGIDVNLQSHYRKTALSITVNSDNVTLVEMLLFSGADISSMTVRWPPFRDLAVMNCLVAVLERSLRAEADCDLQSLKEGLCLLSALPLNTFNLDPLTETREVTAIAPPK